MRHSPELNQSIAFMSRLEPLRMMRGVSVHEGLYEASSPYPPYSRKAEVLMKSLSTLLTE